MTEYIMQYDIDETGKLINARRKEKVIRCKECMYYNPMVTYKPYCCEKGLLDAFENDFCSRGERRNKE